MLLLLSLFGCNEFQVVHETEYLEPNIELHTYRPTVDAIDVVIVLDASGSMSNDLDRFMANSTADIVPALQQIPQSYWRLSAVRADEQLPSDLQLRWIDSFTPNLTWEVPSLLSQLAYGPYSNGEQGLGAALSLVQNPQTFDQFRKEFDLYFIFVSDEEDDSTTSLQTYRDTMKAFKADPAMVYSGALIARANTCGDTEGTRYSDVSEITVDMCGNDYSKITTPILNHYQEAQEPIWTLESLPITESIEVWQEDQLLDQSEWTYLPATNQVELVAVPSITTTYAVIYFEEPNP